MKNRSILRVLFACGLFLCRNDVIAQGKEMLPVTPEKYGARGDGVTDDSKAMIECFTDNKRIRLSGNYLVSKTIEISSGQQVYSENAEIKYIGKNVLLSSVNCSDWQILGKLSISGTGLEEGAAIALYIEGGKNMDVSGLKVENFQGTALTLKPGRNVQRGNCLRLANSVLLNCWTGFYTYAGSEYHSISNVNVTGCQSAVEIRGGNVTWTGGNIGDNVKGVFIGGAYGTNNSHGIFQAVNINHNKEYNLKCDSVELGQTFSGCHIYGEKDRSIIINESRSINFVGGIVDGKVAISGSPSDQHHYFNGVQLEPFFNITPAYRSVYFNNCFTRTGGPYHHKTAIHQKK